MIVEVLLSCMHLNSDEEVVALAQRTNIKGKAVIVSQCGRNDVVKIGDITIVYTTERGLSKSRNMAIRYSTGDICVICDDDEILADDYLVTISEAYEKYYDKDLIAFAIKLEYGKIFPTESGKLRFRQILKTSSLQITFKKSSLVKNGITFDEEMGSGTGNGGGEEVKFMLDFRRCNLNLFYCPLIIATVLSGESQWFKGYDKTYIHNLGWSSRRAMGNFLGFLYIHYWILCHYGLYAESISLPSAYKCIMSGFFK